MEEWVVNHLADAPRVLEVMEKSFHLQSNLIKVFETGSGVLWACSK